MPDKFIDCIVTSPPYDDMRKYNGYSFDFENIANELWRVTKDGGVIIWVIGDQTKDGNESGTSFRQALYFKGLGFNLHDTMIYRKHTYMPLNHNRYEQEWEYMFCFSKGKPKTFNPIKIPCVYAGQKSWGKPSYYKTSDSELTQVKQYVMKDEKIKGNIFEYVVGSTKTGKINHPAVFPEQLAIDQIISWSNEGDLIYDPFLGSGTTALASIRLNRNWIGSEISVEYVKEANKRLEPFMKQNKLF
jgi:DNA modification methylase